MVFFLGEIGFFFREKNLEGGEERNREQAEVGGEGSIYHHFLSPGIFFFNPLYAFRYERFSLVSRCSWVPLDF